MRREEALVVFAYAFAHRKTQDFLQELAYAGFRKVIVIAAPWKPLPHADSQVYFPVLLSDAAPTAPSLICATLGFEYQVVEHDDVDTIGDLCKLHNIKLGIVAGARIIKSKIVALFSEGILNIHPGKIPETSGLDLFYYTIKNRVPMGVTAHYIDGRVDAGELLFFEETRIGSDDTPEIVQRNNYQSQIRALRRFLAKRDCGELLRRPAIRPYKNDPMLPEDKRRVLLDFSIWRSAQVRAQAGRDLIEACERGAVAEVGAHLAQFPDLLEYRTVQGWSPLVVAAFHQKAVVVTSLLEQGADPNGSGKNGTTPLMYAKTAIIEGRTQDFSVMQALLRGGADPFRTDSYGKDIFFYLANAKGAEVSNWLSQYLKEMS